jgi:uncharacterized protein YwqG
MRIVEEMVEKEQVLRLIRGAGLERAEQHLVELLQDSIRVYTRAVVAEVEMDIGTSKLGGRPDLPPDIEYPTRQGRPLAFVAQLNLSELTILDTKRILPPEGMLYFFYDALHEPHGDDPFDSHCWRVFYCPGIEVAHYIRHPRPVGLGDESRFAACYMDFMVEYTLPAPQSIFLESLDLAQEERERYQRLYAQIADLYDSMDAVHRLLGYPESYQQDVLLECQLASSGIYCADGSQYQHPQFERHKAHAREWCLLFQVDTDYEAEMVWGENGRLFYCIRHDFLKQQDFDEVWGILQ